MPIFIEEPCFAVAGKVHTRDGQLVEPGEICPHRFARANTCPCANPLGRNFRPAEEECHGFVFGLPAPDQVCH